MKIVVSACLIGENCKYNGSNNKNEKVLRFLEGKDWVAVCPEVLGGLSTPRNPSEIAGDKVIQKDGTDVTAFFEAGAKKACEIAKKHGAELAVLKANSPSCGCGFIYDGTFSGTRTVGNGITTQKLLDLGIAVKTENDLK
ncbi:MAG: DUF523 domain-containing protein [Clostridia bacterium]|nr:DUF523 domain-containing protein [Clostridia bacterium]